MGTVLDPMGTDPDCMGTVLNRMGTVLDRDGDRPRLEIIANMYTEEEVMKTMLKILTGFLMLPALLLAGCAGATASPAAGSQQGQAAAPSSSQDAEGQTIRVGLLAIDDSFPFYVAREEGLFDKHQVSVDLVDFGSARDQATALQGGELDAIMTDPVVTALSIKGGKDLRIVANALGAQPSEGRFLIVASPESGISQPKDLEGKALAISNNTMMDFLTEQYMKHLGVDYESINLVNMPDLMLRTTTLLEGGDIDAAILPDPLAAYAVMEGAQTVIDDTALGKNFSCSVVAVTTDCLQANESGLDKMLKAYKEAIQMINADPAKYKELALKCANVPAGLHESYQTPVFTPNSIVEEDYISLINSWMVERGLLDKPISYDEIVSRRFID